MGTDLRFVSPTPWSPERPRALVVCCSDGRLHAQVEELLRAQSLDAADLYSVPGGPASFDLWTSSVAENWALGQSLELLVEHHALESIWLIAHEGCAYYRLKNALKQPAEIAELQRRDLRSARGKIAARYPTLAVTSVYASIAEDRVVFTTLGERASGATPAQPPPPPRGAERERGRTRKGR